MSKIKVYVRLRPPLPGEFDTPGCFNCVEMEDVSGNWIRIKKEGEQIRYFARVWGPNSTQEDVFRTIGINTVNDVFEGYYGCVFVYGQTGTGKTYSLGCLTPGLEGIQPQCIKYIFEKIAKESHKYEVTVKQHYVQLYREFVQDLLDITKDNLKIKMDDATGATIEKVTVRDINSYEEAVALIREGDGNRAVANTKMNSASSRSHACLVTEVFRKEKATGNVTFGRLYLIDLAGSERVSKSGVTDDAFKEAVAINKSLTTLGNCIAGLVNGEKVVSFRESPLTRILQHSLSGHGRTSILVTLRPDSPNMQETLCTLKFGERAQKVEAQMTPASYRDNCLETIEKMNEIQIANAEFVSTAQAYKKWAKFIKESIVEKEQEVKDKEVSTKSELDELKQAHEALKKELEEQWKRDQEEINSRTKTEVERLKVANASVIKEIEEKVDEAEKEARDKFKAASKAANNELATVQREHKKMMSEMEELTAAAAPVDFKAKAKEQMLEMELKIKEQRMKLRGCKTSKFEELAEPQLQVKANELRQVLQWTRDKIAANKDLTAGWERKLISRFNNKFEPPTTDQVDAWVDAKAKEIIKPPTPEPEPKKKKWGDDDEEGDNDDDDDGSESAPPSSEAPPSESSEDMDDFDPDELPLGEDGNPIHRPIDKGELQRALERDQQLGQLLEQIVDYLDFGTTCYTISFKEEREKNPTAPPVVRRCHIYLSRNRQEIILCEVKADKSPDKTKVIETIKLAEISIVVLGQYSEGFLRAVEGSPLVPQGTAMPPTSERCSAQSMRVFFYRSMSLLNVKKKSMLDFVLNMDTDFEAWIVTFHRLTMKDPVWGGALDLVAAKDNQLLTEAEKKLCTETHIPPTTVLKVKEHLMEGAPRLYYTLFDMRALSGLDLLHAQKIFTFFIEEGMLERHSVYHVRFMELKREQEKEEQRKAEVRKVRIRMTNMIRFYRKANSKQITDFLRVTQGKEEDTLNKLIRDLGPEPIDDQVTELAELDGLTTEDAVDQAMQNIAEGKTPAAPPKAEAAKPADPPKPEAAKAAQPAKAEPTKPADAPKPEAAPAAEAAPTQHGTPPAQSPAASPTTTTAVTHVDPAAGAAPAASAAPASTQPPAA